jgi:hypothetical protein
LKYESPFKGRREESVDRRGGSDGVFSEGFEGLLPSRFDIIGAVEADQKDGLGDLAALGAIETQVEDSVFEVAFGDCLVVDGVTEAGPILLGFSPAILSAQLTHCFPPGHGHSTSRLFQSQVNFHLKRRATLTRMNITIDPMILNPRAIARFTARMIAKSFRVPIFISP